MPPKEARQAIVSCLQAVQDGRFSAACARLTPEARAELRDLAWGSFRVRPGTLAERERQVAQAHDRARTCPGAIAMLTSELGSKVADLIRGAASAQVSFLFASRELVVLDDEAWVVRRGDDSWMIESYNAISDALPAE
ncbi:MAG: hypothetical protein ABW167_15765 [Baekduia sp.]